MWDKAAHFSVITPQELSDLKDSVDDFVSKIKIKDKLNKTEKKQLHHAQKIYAEQLKEIAKTMENINIPRRALKRNLEILDTFDFQQLSNTLEAQRSAAKKLSSMAQNINEFNNNFSKFQFKKKRNNSDE